MITLKKIIPAGLLFSGLILITAQSQAACVITSSGNVTMGTISSMTLAEQGTQSNQFSAGLRCEGFSLAALNTTYLMYRVDQIPVNYTNSVTDESLTVSYLDTNNKAIGVGKEIDMSTFSLLNFLTSLLGLMVHYHFMPKLIQGKMFLQGDIQRTNLLKSNGIILYLSLHLWG